jgi:hypothetical protein
VCYGLCVTGAKLILLDERTNRGRSWRQMLTTVLHELTHVTHPEGEPHSAAFAETLRRVVAHVLPEHDAEPKPAAQGRTIMEQADDKAVLERIERPLLVKRAIQERREREAAERRDRDAAELYVRASAGALEFMRMFNLGRYLSRDPSPDEMVGKQLAVAFNGYVPLEARAARQARLARVSR